MEKCLDYNKFTISECLSDIQHEKLHLKFYPVSEIVNSTKNNSIQNIREEKPKDILLSALTTINSAIHKNQNDMRI